VADAHPSVSHVASRDGLSSGSPLGKVVADHQVAVLAQHALGAIVMRNAAVAVGAESDDAASVAAGRGALRHAVADGESPFAIEIDVVRGAVAVHWPDSGRAAADLGELEALGAEEPLHVGGGRW
jgi:hypothetical protein